MKGVIYRRAAARRDLIEAYRFYARKAGSGAAGRFLAEAESTFARLASVPGMGSRFDPSSPAFGELRFLPLPSRFKQYLVFYRVVADGIEIARVLHGARDIAEILAEEFGTGPDEVEVVDSLI